MPGNRTPEFPFIIYTFKIFTQAARDKRNQAAVTELRRGSSGTIDSVYTNHQTTINEVEPLRRTPSERSLGRINKTA